MIFRILMLIALAVPTYAHAQSGYEGTILPSYENEDEIADQANVRGFIWGLPKEIIKAEEQANFAEKSEDGKILYYVDRIRGIKSSINYEFDNNKLTRVRIFSEKSYFYPQMRMDDLIKIKRDLDKRFGEPLEQNFIWTGDDYDKDYPKMWGYAILGGNLQIVITWQDAETFVTAYAGTKNGTRPVLFVTYEDRKAKEANMERVKKQSMDIVPDPSLILPQSVR
jgi:hypothetical protein